MVKNVERVGQKYATKQGWDQLKKKARNPKELLLDAVGDVASLAPSSTVTEFAGQIGRGAIEEARKRGLKVPKHLDTALNVGLEAASFVKGKNAGKMLKNFGKIKKGMKHLQKLKNISPKKLLKVVQKKSKGKKRGLKGKPKPKGKKKEGKQKIKAIIKSEVKQEVKQQYQQHQQKQQNRK